MNSSSGSFCIDSSCSYYRSNKMIYENDLRDRSRNFFCFQPVGW
jgi:hypothetical protein